MASAFTTAEIEDGSGKTTALVYYTNAQLSAWLTHTARGYTGFAAATDAAQDKANLKATNVVEEWIRDRVDGVVYVKEQTLTFPRVGSTSRNGRTWQTGEIPYLLLPAIALMAEEEVATGIVRRHAGADLSARSADGVSVTYRTGAKSAAARYPEAWRYAGGLFVPGRRLSQEAA